MNSSAALIASITERQRHPDTLRQLPQRVAPMRWNADMTSKRVPKKGHHPCTVYVPDGFISEIDNDAKALGWSRSHIMLHHLAVAYGRPDMDPLPNYDAMRGAIQQLDMTA